ncbi:MAG: ATP-dependent DNA ligase [Candidatus Aenigmarchaeota archaeon]|nr:ATP-dependent DNA ligase [Candidatus Aenigmarchaeota archaeon]
MRYADIVSVYERLEATPSKLEKARIAAAFLRELDRGALHYATILLTGRVFPAYDARELGVAEQTMIKAVARVSGFPTEDVEKRFAKKGDLGLVAEGLLKGKKQRTLGHGTLTVDRVVGNLQKLPDATGAKSQERKVALVSELLASASPLEARYIVRNVLGDLRVGVAEGIVRDAIVAAFIETDSKERKGAANAVEYAWNILSDFGEVAEIARTHGIRGLRGVRPTVGKPIQMMLGIAAEKISDVTKEHGTVIAQYKYDGMRVQIHKRGERIWVFTRRLEDVTKQFPDIVGLCKSGLRSRECIVDGEALGIRNGKPVPFQALSQRIQRKYDIERMAKEIPVQLNLFDAVYADGALLLDKPLAERWDILRGIVRESAGKFQMAEQVLSDDIRTLEKFYKDALDAGQEGVFLKVPTSAYVFGRHVGGWYKIKPIMETLDLVIVGATWGEGKRTRWLSSYVLACRDPETGRLLECGMLSTGLTEEQYDEVTRTMKPLIETEKGKSVTIKPKVVIEAGYQEIQKSPTYSSGYALRFPRLVRVRTDKNVEEVDTLERVVALYKSQGRKG